MADGFDAFLSEALTPRDGEPDRAFVRRVQAQIRLADHLRAERRRVLTTIALQVLGLTAVAFGAFWVLQSPAGADFAGDAPAILLTVLLATFSFVILLFGTGSGPAAGSDGRARSSL